MTQPDTQQFERLITALRYLRDNAVALEARLAPELAELPEDYRLSARNLLHYLAVRQTDIQALQKDLASLGLSSLGVLEANTMASLNAVLELLHRLAGHEAPAPAAAPVDFATGPARLAANSRALLGPDPANRHVRIMVTMPGEAATDPRLVRDLLTAGMDVMRINCAHDDPGAWVAMVENLRSAERALGRRCLVQADLGGPKLRTGALEPLGQVVKLKPRRDPLGRVVAPGQVWLTASEHPEPPPEGVSFCLPLPLALLQAMEVADELEVADARGSTRCLRIKALAGSARLAEAMRPIYVQSGARCRLCRNGKKLAEATVGTLPDVVVPLELFPHDTLILTRDQSPGRPARRDDTGKVLVPARIPCTLEAAFEQVGKGDRVWFDDGKIGGIVRASDGATLTVEITQTGPSGAKLRPEKGINFPDTALHVPALTDKDIVDLAAVAGIVDMVALSFVTRPEDVLELEEQFQRLDAQHLGIVLKIENRRAFENLPKILLAALRSPPVGVMVARGDLAVELGFERLSEVQEEILWLCEAAHVPVIWATQMLEGLAKKGLPSRAEVTDAAMSSRAECAMLNKGPNIVETVRFLSGVLSRMDRHQYKRKAMLRKLAVAELR